MTLYQRVGGEDGLALALDRFYDKVMADHRLSPIFDGVRLDELKLRQRAFLGMALGGPNGYTGPDLRTSHRTARARGLDEQRFEAFMEHFRQTMSELGADSGTINEVMAIAYTGKDDVLDR